MESGGSETRTEGEWLAAERRRRGRKCSTRLVAELATASARRQGDPVRISQQQISYMESKNARYRPIKLPNWWRYVRGLFDSGELDSIFEAASFAVPAGPPREDLIISTLSGEVIGRIVWTRN